MTPAAPLTANSFAERIAWMHAPVHLSGVGLPWFLVRLIERALHSYLCRAEQYLLMLWELKEQGKLEPWPDEPEAEGARRRSRYKMKFPPAAPQARADVQHAEIVEHAQAGTPDLGASEISGVRLVGIWVTRCEANSRRAGRQDGVSRSRRSGRGYLRLLDGRCRCEKFFRAAWMRRETCVQIVPVN